LDVKKTVLIVDSDRATVKELKAFLQSRCYDVDTAETGREAIEKSQTSFYGLTLLETRLPDMEGIELLAKIREDSRRAVKIIITNCPTLENAVRSLNLGADAYLMKPVDPEELSRVMEEKLKIREESEKMTKQKVMDWIESQVRAREDSMRALIEELQRKYEKTKRKGLLPAE